MDPKLSNCCDFLLKLLSLVRTIKDIGGAVREPRARVIGVSLRKGGAPFLKHFLKRLFSHKYHIFTQNVSQKGTQNEPKSYFIENCSTCVSIEPARSDSMSGLPQIDPNPIKKEMCFKNTFFLTKIRKSMKNDLQKVSKWVSAKRGWRLLGHLWSPSPFFIPKSVAKVLQK